MAWLPQSMKRSWAGRSAAGRACWSAYRSSARARRRPWLQRGLAGHRRAVDHLLAHEVARRARRSQVIGEKVAVGEVLDPPHPVATTMRSNYRNPLARPLLKRRAIGRDRRIEPRGPALPHPQRQQGIAKTVSRRRPVERDPLAGLSSGQGQFRTSLASTADVELPPRLALAGQAASCLLTVSMRSRVFPRPRFAT